MSELLHRIAYDSFGNTVVADDAIKGREYSCPECGRPLILKKSGRTGPGTRRPHFASKNIKGNPHNCNPETVLHKVFKHSVMELLQSYQIEKKPFPVTWTCIDCGQKYSGDLLRVAESVREEYSLGSCKPDIAILDHAGRVVVAIEVVVTHPPEEDTLAFYRDNGIVLVQLNVQESDMNDVVGKLSTPDSISLCFNHHCPSYNNKGVSRQVIGNRTKCRSCGYEYVYCSARMESPLQIANWPELTDQELQSLQKNLQGRRDVFLMKVTFNGRQIVVLRTVCGCKVVTSTKPRIRPNPYYFDARSGRYKRKPRL